MKSAVLFPGQGSQYPGMADPWADRPESRAVLDASSEVLGYDVIKACRDESHLADTAIVQPALFACDLAAFRVLEGEGFRFDAAAGHSLGEFVALVAAGATDLRPTRRSVAATTPASAVPIRRRPPRSPRRRLHRGRQSSGPPA